MPNYQPVAENPESTVVSEYSISYEARTPYETEARLEKSFIDQLCRQGYEHLSIRTEENLISNLRTRLEGLNGIAFSDAEWKRFFRSELANANSGIKEKARTIQEDFVKTFMRDDGSNVNIRLIDKENVHRNALQVINQYVPEGGARENRYDVTILVNGLPLVHVELKRRGVDIREAFNQIRRYERESFWSGSGLFDYVQIFVISNGTFTKYYANTTRERGVKESRDVETARGKRTSCSFEFTSWWADAQNKAITDLRDFTRTFFVKGTLLNMLTKYCVFTADENLLVMRPYQVAATERIIGRIRGAQQYRRAGNVDAGGYIWHTTGSGKTLTSFKTAQLATRIPGIAKVLFVVDRKDLDYQTMKEYDRFQEGAANGNTNTAILTRQLGDANVRIIITTIQKLSIFVRRNQRHEIFGREVVIIFDECHRSQFGAMHREIREKFNRCYLFGFTGTPIFAENAGTAGNGLAMTTEQVFGEQLHSYTIVDAIRDKNVLPFRVEYVSTMRGAEEIEGGRVAGIDTQRILNAPQRIENVTRYVLEHFAQKTARRSERRYEAFVLRNVRDVARARGNVAAIREKRSLCGFNSIFAAASIESAKFYYAEFKRQMAEHPEKKLKIALIYSFAANEAEPEDDFYDENSESTEGLDESSRDFLEEAIRDYNQEFRVNYDTQGFQDYYKDVSERLKNRELDMLIVVNMFLTGFDATTLNTLWVDKNLRMHGLIQAFSRTNRILNSVKTFGNIVCFRNLEKATNKALSIFGNKEAGGIAVLRKFDDYYEGYDREDGEHVAGYKELIGRLTEEFPLNGQIEDENAVKSFIRLYGDILKMKNILTAFDDFAGQEILSEGEFQDYQSRYLRFYDEFRNRRDGDKEDVTDDIVFEMELVKQVDIDISYILALVAELGTNAAKDKEICAKIDRAVDSSPKLRDKKDLIKAFISRMDCVREVGEEWCRFVSERREEEFRQIVADEHLEETRARRIMYNAFRDGYLRTTGTEFAAAVQPMKRFGDGNSRTTMLRRVEEKLRAFLERFRDLSNENFSEAA